MRLNQFIVRAAFFLLSVFLCAQANAKESAREKLSLDRDWLFHLGDITPPKVIGIIETYDSTKAGGVVGAAAVEFDDSDWKKINIPHDWAVEGPFDPNENISQGYRPRGVGWYRRYLQMDESDRGRHIELQFDGIATHSTIWVNGNVVHRNWSGYSASYIDITPYLHYGDLPNTIAIRVDANPMEGWWYEGAGMYRHAWLVKRSPVHIITDGVHATPRLPTDNALNGKWEIPISVTLQNIGEIAANVEVKTSVFDPDKKMVTTKSQSISIPVLAQGVAQLPVEIESPKLWSIKNTHLYKVATQVIQNGKVVDETSLYTGFRKIHFDASKGFFLNNEHVKLKGICMHQDHAGVGVAIPDAIWEYRLRRLKELGVNAIRFSHNAPAPEVLDLVDRMGFVVMDENRNFNPSPDYMKQLEWMVRRDRHHPSVILWSVFNEEPMQGTAAGYEMVRRMSAAVKALDDTRPVTAAMNGGFFTELNVSHAVDVLGANYQARDHDRIHQFQPELPFTSSEDTSAFMTRGNFTTTDGTMSGYDEAHAPWGNTHRDAWQAIDERDYIAGSFVWTGFDYRGEPQPNRWPWVNSSFGIMDLNGFAKAAYYIRQAQWIKDRPLIHIEPHWNWSGREGEQVRVMVTSNVEKIKLLLNGRELEEQKVDSYQMNMFNVTYQPGKLEAIGFINNKEVIRTEVETTGAAEALQLLPDRASLVGDGRDAMTITVRALDAKGRAVPTENVQVTFDVVGEGASIGHGNGDPTSHENEKGKTRKLFNGLAQLIIQSDYEANGFIQVSAAAEGLKSAHLRIPVKKVSAIPYVVAAEAPPNVLTKWRMSGEHLSYLSAREAMVAQDLHGWGWTGPPMLATKESAGDVNGFRVFRTDFTPRKNVSNGNGKILLEDVSGTLEIWLDGVLVAEKKSKGKKDIRIKLPAGNEVKQLSIIAATDNGNNGVLGKISIIE